jgi:hypothetical protein
MMMMRQDLLDDDGDAKSERERHCNPYLYEKERSYSEAIIQPL